MESDNLDGKVETTNRLLDSRDVARLLNISRSQAYLMMREGLIPTVRFRSLVRVRIEDLQTFIERNLVRDDCPSATMQSGFARDAQETHWEGNKNDTNG